MKNIRMQWFVVLTVFVSLVSVFALSCSANAAVREAWVTTYNGGYGDNLYAMAKDSQGNIYFGGDVYYNNSNTHDASITKINPAGTVLWTAKYSGGYTDTFMSIATDASGNVYGAGTSYVTGTYQYEMLVVKFDANGNQQWVAKHNIGSLEAMKIDASGNIFVSGFSYDINTYALSIVMIKYDTNGNEIWASSTPALDYGQPYFYYSEIAFDSAGDAYLIANGGSNQGVVSKYDASNGNVLWWQAVVTVGCPGIGVDSGNNVYVSGGGVTSKINPAGTLLWMQTYESQLSYYCPENDRVAVDAAGSVYVTGGSNVAGQNGWNEDFTTLKYDTNGNLLWVRTYDGGTNNFDRSNDLKMDSYGNIFVTGEGSDVVTGEYYLATIKYDTNGVQQWVMRYTKPDTWLGGPFLEVDSSGSAYVVGYDYSMTQNAGWDNVVIKYSEGPSSIADIISTINDFLNNGKIKNSGIANALIHLLQNAKANMASSPGSAKNMLEAALKIVAAQNGKGISADAATDLTSYIQAIINTIN